MRIILFLWLFFAGNILLAQSDTLAPKSFYLKLGSGLARQALRDRAMSPLLYSGFQGAFQVGFDAYRPKGMHRLDIIFWYGPTSARSGRSTQNYTFAINGGYLRPLRSGPLQLGGACTTWGSFREHQTLVNSYFFYDVFIAVGPTAIAAHDFRMFKKQWHLDGQLTIPLLVLGARPAYSGLESIPFTGDDFPNLRSVRVGSLDLLQNIKLRLEIVRPLKHGNRLGLLYYWDFYRTTVSPQPITQSMQSLQINLHVRL